MSREEGKFTMAVHCAVPATNNGRGTQMPYIKDLMQQRALPDEPRQGHPEDPLMLERLFDVFGSKMICRHEASDFIDWLLLLNLKDGSPPPPPKPTTQYRRRYPGPRPGSRSAAQFTTAAAQRSHALIAADALAVARQLAAQPGVKERMRLVEQISALEQELTR